MTAPDDALELNKAVERAIDELNSSVDHLMATVRRREVAAARAEGAAAERARLLSLGTLMVECPDCNGGYSCPECGEPIEYPWWDDGSYCGTCDESPGACLRCETFTPKSMVPVPTTELSPPYRSERRPCE